MTGKNSTPAQSVATAGRKSAPADLEYSVSESSGRPKKQLEKGSTRPLKKSEKAGFDAEAERKDVTKHRLRLKMAEIGQTPQSSGTPRQTSSLEPFKPPPADSRVEKSGEPDFNEKRRTISNKAFEQAAGQAISATKTESVTVAPKAVGARLRVSSEPFRVTEKPSKVRVASTEELGQKPALSSSELELDQQAATIRAVAHDIQHKRSGRNYAGRTADIQNMAPMHDRFEQRLHATAGGDSASADSFWPDLSGLEKTPANRDRWPELPDDVWNELRCRQDAATNIRPEQADINIAEELWNG